jgi:ABC-type dipeptide/oligopeptide/nickel transport system permease subunit
MTVPLDTEPRDTAEAPAIADASPEIAGRSLASIAWGRLRRDKVALVGAAMIIVFLLVAIFAPLLCQIVGVDPESTHTELLDDLGFPIGPWAGASWQHPLGIEPGLARDIFARTVFGARYSLTIALLATVLTVVIGVVAGIIAGFRGGWIDTLISRNMDILLAFPVLLFSIASLVIVGQTQWYKSSVTWQVLFLTFVIGFFGWPYIGRIIRGQVLSLREKEFVDAARSIGAPTRRILFKELLPNLLPIILVYSTLIIPSNILAEAALSFLGVGLQPPTPTWGQMLSDSVGSFQLVPFYMAVPGTAIFLCVLAFNLFGDGLRDAFDPKGTQ